MAYLHLRARHEQNLIDFLCEQSQLSPVEVLKVIEFGGLYKNEKRWMPSGLNVQVTPSDRIRFHHEPRRYDTEQLQKVRIIVDASDFVAVHKPPGIPSHPTLDNIIETTQAQTERLIEQPLLSLSRLDRGTQGILVFAKNKEFAKAFNEQMINKKISKVYAALCQTSNPIKPGVLKHKMLKTKMAPKVISESGELNCELEIVSTQKIEVTDFDLTHYDFKLDHEIYMYQIRLITGRTHQIRAQLSFEHSPILGDQMYQSSILSKSRFERFALTCYHLECLEIGLDLRLNLKAINW